MKHPCLNHLTLNLPLKVTDLTSFLRNGFNDFWSLSASSIPDNFTQLSVRKAVI